MQYLADTHMHSIYSYDGQMCIPDMVEKGIELGLKYMAFTEHLEFGQISLKQFLNRYQIYSREVDKLQEEYPEITLIKGVEFSNPEKYPHELEEVNKLDLDYIIGSNHEYPKDNNELEILKYYKSILDMVKLGGIDSLGHLDYLRRKYDDSLSHNEPLRKIRDDLLREIYSYLIVKNIALEINSSAVRRCGLDSFPSDEKLKLYESCGGKKVTIGSDAHRLNEIYDAIPQIDEAYKFDKGLYLRREFISLSQK
ncbi:MAG: histidinol-phosphatase HisJ family protein [Bacilli bacterium]|nr:histidinol-phosphatase HisJ family protein [Bacilli bacterium]